MKSCGDLFVHQEAASSYSKCRAYSGEWHRYFPCYLSDMTGDNQENENEALFPSKERTSLFS